MTKLTTIDLFAGAGGLSYGFLLTNKFDIKVAVEMNKHAQKTYQKNHSSAKIEDNIINLNYSQLKSDYGEFDIVIGGPPCQGFSNANRQKNDLICGNNQLVKHYIKAIEELKPKAFVMENVKGINSKKHKFFYSSKDKTELNSLDIQLNNEIIPIGDAILSPKEFIAFLDKFYKEFTNDLSKKYTIPKEIYLKINSIYRNSKSGTQKLIIYLQKHSSTISKLLDRWEYFHDEFWCEDYKNIWITTKKLLMTNLKIEQNYQRLKKLLNIIIECQKVFFKVQEAKTYDIDITNFHLETTHICIEVKTYNVIEFVIKKFKSLGYLIDADIINAAQFGVPQNRNRFIIIGVQKEALKTNDVKLPVPIITNSEEYYTIGHAIHDLENYMPEINMDSKPQNIQKNENDITLTPFEKYLRDSKALHNHVITNTQKTALERFKLLKPGQNFHDLNESYKTTYSDPTRTQNTIYKRLDYCVPSDTVVNVRKSMWIHPKKNRAISIREAARLQSFPDSFIFYGPKDSQYQQIGNAVPPLLGKALATKVLELLGYKVSNSLDTLFT